jgi:hypothetical protein
VESRFKKDFGSDQNLSYIEIISYFKQDKIPDYLYIINKLYTVNYPIMYSSIFLGTVKLGFKELFGHHKKVP